MEMWGLRQMCSRSPGAGALTSDSAMQRWRSRWRLARRNHWQPERLASSASGGDPPVLADQHEGELPEEQRSCAARPCDAVIKCSLSTRVRDLGNAPDLGTCTHTGLTQSPGIPEAGVFGFKLSAGSGGGRHGHGAFDGPAAASVGGECWWDVVPPGGGALWGQRIEGDPPSGAVAKIP